MGHARNDLDYFWMMYQVLVARDRFFLYQKALKTTTNGGIIISDRFPLDFVKMMDGSKCSKAKPLSGKPFGRWLIEKEKKYYKYFIIPDILIALRVHPDIAVARKTDEEPNYVRRRSTEFYNIDWNRPQINLIDASLSKEEVLKLSLIHI